MRAPKSDRDVGLDVDRRSRPTGWVPADVEEDLVWWANGWPDGDMGRKSTMGGVMAVLERGALVQGLQRDDNTVQRGAQAVQRLRRVEERLAHCTKDQRFMLSCAFRVAFRRDVVRFEDVPTPPQPPEQQTLSV